MSHPFIKLMEAAILQVEARFMAQRGLPSPMLVQELKERLATHTMREALASEPEVLPRHKRRGTWHLDNGEIIDFPKDKRGRTRFLRRNYNANDVALLQQIVEMQPRTFTFEQITAGRKFKASANQIERIRKGQL
jgi:hypothetical protein